MKRRAMFGAAIVLGTAIAARRVGARRTPVTRTPVARATAPSRAVSDRPSLTLALLAFALSRAQFRIPGPWDDIVDAGKSIVSTIKDWVVDLITSIFDFLWGWAVDIYAWIIGGFKDIWKFARELSDWSIRVVNSVIDLVNRKVSEVTNFASWIVAELRNEMYALIKSAAGTVIDLAGFAGRIIQDAYNLVAEKIYWPLWHLIEDTKNWILNHVFSVVGQLIQSAITSAIGALLELPRRIDDIWRWITNTASFAIDIVLKAKDFLLFVITHPLSWWLSYLERIVESAPEYLFRGVANAAERNAGTMEDWIVKAIGS